MNSEKSPSLIWVVGDDTNVGKTTVSVALIRSLNQLGQPTVGFKPYAGARLLDIVPLLEEIANGDGFWVGRDARKLVEASPLLTKDLLEIVNPSWRISYPSRDVGLFIRKGSALLENRRFRCTRSAESIWKRPDFVSLSRSIQLPIQDMNIIDDAVTDRLDFDEQRVQSASFDILKSLNPAFVVCEGAGRLLPVWFGAPSAQHLFLVSAGMLKFFPDVNITVADSASTFGPYTVAHIVGQLKNRKHWSAYIPVATGTQLEPVMDAFVRRFTETLL